MATSKPVKSQPFSGDTRLKQFSISEAQTLLGYKTRGSVYKLIENGLLEHINPQKHVARITGSSLMDYLEATNAGKTPQAKYTKKDTRAVGATAPVKIEKGSSATDKLREWMGLKK